MNFTFIITVLVCMFVMFMLGFAAGEFHGEEEAKNSHELYEAMKEMYRES